MRIGLFSDVHGNLAGLQAVATALEHEGPLDHVVVAGDHLWGGPRPRGVWQLMNELGWTLVLGNADENLVGPTVDQDFPPGNRYRLAAIRQREWLRKQLDPSDLNALASLRIQHRIATPAGDLLVVHSSPRSTIDRCGGPHNSIVEVEAAYSGTGASAIAFGHWHAAFVRQTPFALLLNVASVGLPMDGRPLAAYTILSATYGGWIVEQRRVAYDPEEERRAARSAGLPAWVPDSVDPHDSIIAQ
ncbi:MAG: metallophosphoesterase family protein [Chloroflexota bacterium]